MSKPGHVAAKIRHKNGDRGNVIFIGPVKLELYSAAAIPAPRGETRSTSRDAVRQAKPLARKAIR
jgi:hypothetical protein